MIKMSKKQIYLIQKLWKNYADFESTLVPEDGGKQSPEKSYTNKYQNHVACSYIYKLVCIDDNFSKPLKSYLGKVVVYSFINSMIEESKFCTKIMKKHANKELAKTKINDKDF